MQTMSAHRIIIRTHIANHILEYTKHNVTSWSRVVIILLCSVLVWPHLDHCVQFCLPQFKKDVQRTATNMVKGLEGMTCEERLRTLRLSSLEKMRLRDDFIAFYSFLRRGSGEGGAELFSLVSCDRMYGDG